MELKDWLKSINQSKINLIDEDPSLEKEYNPYIINRILSGNIDCLMFANAINEYHFLPKKMQYDFLINGIRKRKRFAPWIYKNKIEDVEIIKEYYNYNNQKAEEALKILKPEEIDFIKSKFEKGGNYKN